MSSASVVTLFCQRHTCCKTVTCCYLLLAAVQYMHHAGKQFDAVMGLEIVEHVDQPQQFLKTLASLTKSDGALFISTINRTPRGYAVGILGAEYIAGVLPKGTHDWDKFLTPGD